MILVIEDETLLREEVVQMLHYEGYAALGAPDGVAGIQLAQDQRPDLIVCDIMMPEMDGYQVLERVRQSPTTATVPFIFLTAKTERDDVRRGMEIGADDYVTKPFTTEELLAAIRARLHRQAVLDEHHTAELEEIRTVIDRTFPHEMRTPLTIIQGYAALLMADAQVLERDKIYEMADAISKSGTRLQRLIENYLLYAQLNLIGLGKEQEEMIRRYGTSSSTEIINSIAVQRAHEHCRSVDLFLDVAAVELRVLGSDMHKIVYELVDNAFKFSEAGTPVEVVGSMVNDAFVLRVRDSGIGMSPEELAARGAFRQFDRDTREQQGMGLGLTIAQRLVEVYQGQLEIESTPGAGTTIWIHLPTQ